MYCLGDLCSMLVDQRIPCSVELVSLLLVFFFCHEFSDGLSNSPADNNTAGMSDFAATPSNDSSRVCSIGISDSKTNGTYSLIACASLHGSTSIHGASPIAIKSLFIFSQNLYSSLLD